MMRIPKLPLFSSAVLILSCSTLLANPAPQPPDMDASASGQTVSVADDEKPALLFKQGVAQLQAFFASGHARNPAVVKQFIGQKVRPYFDFERMARLVGGPFYKKLDAQKKAAFRSKLEMMFLSAFAKEVALTSGQQLPPRIDFIKKRHSRDGQEMEVMGRVLYPNGAVKRLVLSFNKTADGWKIFDVSANGSSAVLYYRQYFMAMARKFGPDALLN